MAFGDELPVLVLSAIFIGAVIIIGILYVLNNIFYPSLKLPNTINAGTAQSGLAGGSGNDGNYGTFATPATDGEDGKKGMDGLKGFRGRRGIYGPPGGSGALGLGGQPGVVGLPGLPSNSKVSLIEKYELSESTSYILRDSLIFNNAQYVVSMYANVDNNNRFVLPANTKIDDSVMFEPAGTINTDPDIKAFEGINFYSSLRVVVGYGRGSHNSNARSDDCIIYVSPPITRNTRLLRYNLVPNLNEELGRVDIKFPTTIANNTFDFIFADTAIENGVATQRLHIMYGLANYDLVVNVSPRLPSEFNLSYRVVEQFGISFPSSDFPAIKVPFDSVNLTYRDMDKNILAISNRFDVDRVIERRLEFEGYPWKQSNKRFVEINTIDTVVPVLFENTHIGLEKDYIKTFNQIDMDTVGSSLDKSTYPIIYIDKNKDFNNGSVEIRLRKYTPSVPLRKYYNLEKVYIEFKMIQVVEDPLQVLNSSTEEIPKKSLTVIYGKTYDFDLLDFQNIYSRTIYFSRFFQLLTNNFTEVPAPMTLPSQTDTPVYRIDYSSPFIVGFTNTDGERFVTQISCQGEKTDDFLFINIPLYGYKKV